MALFDILFDILNYSIGSLIWGLLIAFLCMSLFVFLIKGWYKDATFSIISYLVGTVLFFLLTFQCILIVGSLKIIDMSNEYELKITQIVDSSYYSGEEIPTSQTSLIIGSIIEEYPILGYYISGGAFYGYTTKELPHAITQELKSVMRWYIFRRVLWCLGFAVIGAVLVIKSLSRPTSGTRRQTVRRDLKRISRKPRR